MEIENSILLRKWQEASLVLGIEITAPYFLLLPNSSQVKAHFLVKNFGNQNGMLVFTELTGMWEKRNIIMASGYGFSILDEPTQIDSYSVENIIEILNDWGWSGTKGLHPSWHSPRIS